jgi:hypothetical protein
LKTTQRGVRISRDGETKMMREDNLPLPSRRFSTGLKRKRNQSIDIDDLTWMESTKEAHMELTTKIR